MNRFHDAIGQLDAKGNTAGFYHEASHAGKLLAVASRWSSLAETRGLLLMPQLHGHSESYTNPLVKLSESA
jgi:hypothetical protein